MSKRKRSQLLSALFTYEAFHLAAKLIVAARQLGVCAGSAGGPEHGLYSWEGSSRGKNIIRHADSQPPERARCENVSCIYVRKEA